MDAREQTMLSGNRWVIMARWYYLLGLLLIAFIIYFDRFNDFSFLNVSLLTNKIFAALVLIIAFNAWFYLIVRNIEANSSLLKKASRLGACQFVFEIVLIVLLLLQFYESQAVLPALFLVPIIESIVLFDAWAPIFTGVLVGIILNLVVIVEGSNLVQFLLGKADSFQVISGQSFSELVTSSLILSVIFVVTGILVSFTGRLIRERENQLSNDSTIKENQLAELRTLNRELGEKARELSAKDLELTMANKRLQTLEEAKSKFISVTTHQLRTPLSAIKWAFDMMVKGQLGAVNDEQKQFLNQGLVSTQRVISIVNELLSMDSIESPQADLNFSLEDLAKLIENTIFEFSNQALSKKITLDFQRPEKELPPIEMDPTHLRMVLENMIDNSIKYTPEGGQVTVKIIDQDLNTSKNSIEVIVQDSGIGIGGEDRSKIFNKFFRAPNAVRQEPDGSGIGLYIAKDIIEKHKGTIWFESEPGKGTTFHFTLPLRQNNL